MRGTLSIAKNIIIVVPMYNEEEVVESVVKGLACSFENILVVDDGSTDSSSEILSRLGVSVLSHCINLGQGAAITTAFRYLKNLASSDIVGVVTCDADGQHSLDDIVAIATELLVCDEDVIFGSRFLGHEENIPYIRRKVLALVTRLTNRATGVRLTDTHNGVKAIKMPAVCKINVLTDGYAFETELITQIGRHQFKYKEMPTNTIYTSYSLSKGQKLRNGLIILEDLMRLVVR